VCRRQARQARRQEPRDPLARHHPHGAARVPTEARAPPVNGRRSVRHALRHRQEALAFGGQAMPVRRSLEEPRAHAALELSHVSPDGGLSQTQRASRPSQAASLRDGEEHPQIVPLHGPELNSLRSTYPVHSARPDL
jgi:hypothetical protein